MRPAPGVTMAAWPWKGLAGTRGTSWRARWSVPALGVLALLLAGLPAGGSPVALAQEPSPIALRAEVGFGGQARVGRWTPVVVELENRGPDVSGEVRVGGGSSTCFSPYGGTTPCVPDQYVAEVVLPRGSHKRLTLYVPFLGSTPQRLEVALVSGRRELAFAEAPVSPVGEDEVLVGVVGQRVGAWNLLTTLQLPGRGRRVVVAPVGPDAFPQRPEVLDGFDVIALGDTGGQPLSPRALEALEAWVASGGTLVLSGGTDAAVLRALPVALLPVTPGDTVELEALASLEGLAGEALPLAQPVSVLGSQAAAARVLAQEEGVPLAALGRYGHGGVLFLAFDPAAQPFAGWVGMPALWRELLSQALPIPGAATVGGSSGGSARFGGAGGSLRLMPGLTSAVQNLPALEVPSANVLLGLIGGYILLVGPLNYLALRRLRRPGWAWGTIPALVLLFAAGTYFLALYGKGSDVLANTVRVVRLTPDTPWARVQQVVGVFVPQEGSYRVEVPGGALVASVDGGFFGRRGPGGGGDAVVRIAHTEEGTLAELERVGMWTLRTLWSEAVQRADGRLEHDLRVEGDRLKGTLSNGTGMALGNVWVVAGSSVHDLGALGPGAASSVDVPLAGQAGWSGGGRFPLSAHPAFHVYVGASDPATQRKMSQLYQALSAVLGEYEGGGSRASLLLVAWSDEAAAGVTVGGVAPQGASLTLFVQPVEPALRGAFSLPAGVLAGRLVGAPMARSLYTLAAGDAGAFIQLQEGSLTFQLEVPPEVQALERLALQLPVSGPTSPAPEVALYRWDTGAWEPVAVRTVSIPGGGWRPGPVIRTFPVPAPPPGAVPTPTPAPLPSTAYVTAAQPFVAFSEALEATLEGPEAIVPYVSPTGAVRVRVTHAGADVVHVAVPTLALEGVARG